MADYTPTFTITNTMLDCAASISEKIGKMSALKNLEAKPHLRKNNRIRSIYSSLRIEANSLSIGQVRDVISGQLVLGEQKEIRNRNQCSMRNSVRSIRQTGGKTSSMRNSMWSI